MVASGEPAVHHATPRGAAGVAAVALALCDANQRAHDALGGRLFPSRGAIASLVGDLRVALYPDHFGSAERGDARGLRPRIEARLQNARHTLEEQLGRGLTFTCSHTPARGATCATCERLARSATDKFLGRLPTVRKLLDKDVEAAFRGDPAAKLADEPLFCYPGVTAIIQHRLAHELYRLGVPLLPRMISELAHASTGIDIHPGAQIGESFFIDHGTGVVIGETCSIGARVRLYQGVTLGARGFPTNEDGQLVKGLPRHPIVEDDVVVYAGATILGRITIGKGATIGGNVWLTHSVPPGRTVAQARVRQERFENGAGI